MKWVVAIGATILAIVVAIQAMTHFTKPERVEVMTAPTSIVVDDDDD